MMGKVCFRSNEMATLSFMGLDTLEIQKEPQLLTVAVLFCTSKFGFHLTQQLQVDNGKETCWIIQ